MRNALETYATLPTAGTSSSLMALFIARKSLYAVELLVVLTAICSALFAAVLKRYVSTSGITTWSSCLRSAFAASRIPAGESTALVASMVNVNERF